MSPANNGQILSQQVSLRAFPSHLSPRRPHENRNPSRHPPDTTRFPPIHMADSPIRSVWFLAAKATSGEKPQDPEAPKTKNSRRLPYLSRRKGVSTQRVSNSPDALSLE